jgi:hypothetical protein
MKINDVESVHTGKRFRVEFPLPEESSEVADDFTGVLTSVTHSNRGQLQTIVAFRVGGHEITLGPIYTHHTKQPILTPLEK